MDSINQSANLVLSHSQISLNGVIDFDETASSEVGSWSRDKAITTWKINMRQLCGELWNRYNVFGIRLNSHSYEIINNWANSADDMSVSFNMTGLNFLNCSYDVVTQTNGSTYNFYNNFIGTNGGTYFLSPTQSVGFFSKGADNVELTIILKTLIDNTYVTPTGASSIPSQTFKFDIFPVS